MPSIWTDWHGVYRICNDLSASEYIDGPNDTIKITAYRPNQVRERPHPAAGKAPQDHRAPEGIWLEEVTRTYQGTTER